MLHRCQSIYSGFLRTCIAANLLSRLHLTNEEQTCQHEFALSGRGIRSQRTVAVWSRWVCSRPKSEFRTCTRRLSSWRHTASRSPFATVHRPGQIKILSMPSQIGAEREVRVRGKKKTGTKKSVPACELAGRPDKLMQSSRLRRPDSRGRLSPHKSFSYAVLRGRIVKSRNWVRTLDICIPLSCETNGIISAMN